MPGGAPPGVRVLLLLVLCAVGEVARGIPLLRVAVDGGVGVDVAEMVGHESAVGDDLVPDRDVSAADVATEGGAEELQADAVFEAEFEDFEISFPCVEGDGGELREEGRGGVGAVLFGDGGYLGEGFGGPFGAHAEVDEDPSGVDAAV